MEGVLAFTTLFAGNFAPRGWAFCQGQLLAISQNSALFSLIGTFYGGNGTTTFALPDLRGRCVVGVGQGPGLSSYSLGQLGGTETMTMLSNQMPAHAHPVSATITPNANSSADSATPQNAVHANASNSEMLYGPTPTADSAAYNATITMNPTGSGFPFPIRNPALGLNYIICLQGIYPSRN